MSIVTILLFFVYTFGLGYSITYFFKNSDNFFERWLVRLGIGLGGIPFLLVLFNLFHIPIDWKLVLVVSLVIPVVSLIIGVFRKRIRIPNIKLDKSNLYFLIVLVVFFLTLFMYVKGSFIYPYLEDYDPWAHAVGVKYISVEKNFDDPNDKLVYVKPYPPGYDGLMAILHQTSPSLMWTLKFFNALIISLGIVFFYFFTKNFMHNKDKALVATFILAMIPCYLSHFIWAHSLAMTLLIVALYCLTMIDIDNKWVYPTMLLIAGICLTQPSKAMKFFFIFAIYFIVKSIYSKKFLVREFLVIISGYLLSLVWWLTNWRDLASGYVFGRYKGVELPSNIFIKTWKIIKKMFPPTSGSATRAYTFEDFFIAKSQNMINNPIGIGIVICLLFLVSLILIFYSYKNMKNEKKKWIIITLGWFLFTFLAVNSMTFHLPIGFYSFRVWMILAIPVSIIAAEGFWFVVGFPRQLKIPKIIIILLLVFLIFLTSGKQKYAVNTAIWYPGNEWTNMEDSLDYAWLRNNLPVNSRVFVYTGDEKAIAFDMFSCLWCDDVIGFRKDILNKNVSELYSWLKRRNYQYLTIDGTAFNALASTFGENRTNELLPKRFEEIGSFENFQVVHQTKGMAVFKVS